jgi:NADH-quinone oxidoreductase subunit I
MNFWERLYLPAILGGFKVTLRHFFKRKVTLQYPEEKWVVPAGYRGAPYLVRDPEGKTKCVSCQLCEFICPPKAIKIIPPGPDGPVADRPNAEKMPLAFEIDMLRCIFCGFCQEVCPEEAIFLMEDYSLTGRSRREMIYDKEMLLALGGNHVGFEKWKRKADEARAQGVEP